MIRANTVRADLRISSLLAAEGGVFRGFLWMSRALNLVHRADGAWNVESILLQAARMPAAPTAQKGAGGGTAVSVYRRQRGRGVNLKQGLEKMPLSLTDADFALWLPETKMWRLRLKGHPTRTDAPGTDSGLVQVEATLGQATTLADVPVQMTGDWTAAPLGAVSRVVTGDDAGLRGEMTLSGGIRGDVRAESGDGQGGAAAVAPGGLCAGACAGCGTCCARAR